ncbi:class I SAM-dependent methyltransferase [Mesobacillus maritimus]|uniref:class I SAM-dependent methyltransferase n=1 Tax=Mesobacillus maritimus TaxID=1643336 RepID=UPI0020400827|nr:class I SAM-dependent methyltransferase [Mesobacillus maritimus]MCM3670965.1 class I SAM-dependent methyltransferase [Mesobacillus maritimus]
MLSNYFFGPFKAKAERENVTFVEDFYLDEDFVNLYNMALQNDRYDDLQLIQSNVSFEDSILEIGSGAGRIFNVLAEEGYMNYGMEPSDEMNKHILPDYQHRIFNLKIQEIKNLQDKGLRFTKILIPATTVSLFTHQEFEQFLFDAKGILEDGGKIIFDFIHPLQLHAVNGKVSVIQDGRDHKFYLANYLHGHTFTLNVFLQSEEECKLSYSVKNVYTLEFVKEVCEKRDYDLRTIFEDEAFMMLELTKNG